MHQRPPRGPVALDHDLARSTRKAHKVVNHKIDSQTRGDAIGGGVAKKGRAEIVVCELRDILLGTDLGLSVRCDGVERRVQGPDRKSTRLNSSHSQISYA